MIGYPGPMSQPQGPPPPLPVPTVDQAVAQMAHLQLVQQQVAQMAASFQMQPGYGAVPQMQQVGMPQQMPQMQMLAAEMAAAAQQQMAAQMGAMRPPPQMAAHLASLAMARQGPISPVVMPPQSPRKFAPDVDVDPEFEAEQQWLREQVGPAPLAFPVPRRADPSTLLGHTCRSSTTFRARTWRATTSCATRSTPTPAGGSSSSSSTRSTA